MRDIEFDVQYLIDKEITLVQPELRTPVKWNTFE